MPPAIRKPVTVVCSSRLARLAAAVVGVVAAVACPVTSSSALAASAASTAALKAVSYRGYEFRVPRSWPVINLAKQPDTCVRFDLHAVYLGEPGVNQNCPSWLLGATEALVIEPGSAQARRSSTENPVAHEITVTVPRVQLTATFNTDPTVIYRILASAGLPAPQIVLPNPARLAAAIKPEAVNSKAGAAAQELTVAASSLSAAKKAKSGLPEMLSSLVANYVGLGFDACAAPSVSFMRTWRRRSPYRAIGIYIGGSDRACDQVNLTAGWVRKEAAAGWRFIPTYAGPQVAFGQVTAPGKQGTAAAKDAVLQAERLGLGPGTPLYYDMEAYGKGQAGLAVRFLSAWTKELHKLGYESGVYSSAFSAITALAKAGSTNRTAMPDVMYEALWNGAGNASGPVIGRGEWAGRRLHQFSGNVLQTFGGDTMDIDQDYLDVSVTAAGGTTQAAPGATGTYASSAASIFYQGTDDQLWGETRSGAGVWMRTDLAGGITSAPSVVQLGESTMEVFYQGPDEHLWEVTRNQHGWQAPQALTQMGEIGGGPLAVAQPDGVIDVFWKGSSDDHLWVAQYSPGKGWHRPEDLGGNLASWPSPVETVEGTIEVFWQGTDGKLWRVTRGLTGSWTRPQSPVTGLLGGAPHAVALPDGEIDVFWPGDTSPHDVWGALIGPRGKIRGPVDFGGPVAGQPWPVYAAGLELVLFRGPDGHLWEIARKPNGGWAQPTIVSKMGILLQGPVAAAGSGRLEAFWRGPGGQLWVAAIASASSGWQGPVDLGGSPN